MLETERLVRSKIILLFFVILIYSECAAQVYPDSRVDSLLRTGIYQIVNQNYKSAKQVFNILNVEYSYLPFGKIWVGRAWGPAPLPFIMFEAGELRHASDRIVRVGTHKGDNFRSRIREHYLLDGMHRFHNNSPSPKDRSIFRKNIGRALLNKRTSTYLSIWENDFTKKAVRQQYGHERDTDFEYALETEITEILRKTFSFRFIEVDDQELRMGGQGLKGRLIGTLSHCELCQSSSKWLGHHSPKRQIRESGLWHGSAPQ